ncbi:hypothetical protein E4K67_09445 [Desulfosporosinus fructosivorans]|uniref:Uncharacterized protein n=1 Tax=Desulfosporosinus fructosivorans TaxID=2018669 RepID=A0A4Z0R9A3_9FIRM|nr:hypothetical protein [Desulfosporosinus fructosivorans]TGE38186.1 hypothetical protein E4K67_09445 [Desulfosporosinus fructosivorans]
MTERLNNDQITQRIMDANSDLKRYLNLAPGIKLTPPTPKTTNNSQNYNYPTLASRPNLRP